MEAKELELRIVHLDHVLLHEEIEKNRVDALIERLRFDRVLKNPPIVTAVRDGAKDPRYIVLDGASRTTALRALSCRDILVQVVSYATPGIRLEAWHHLLLDVSPLELRRELDDLACVAMEEMSEEKAENELEQRKIIGYLKFGDGRVAGLRCSADPAEQAAALRQIVETYERKATMYRVSTTDLEQLVGKNRQLSAVMVFPRYRPDEIIRFALNGVKVPMGITRHIIPGRALRVNLPLEMLENEASLSDKNARLDRWLKDKINTRSVRYYQEPVFLFDE